jgi:glycosyltransferase involved in cell wall biosynthesis
VRIALIAPPWTPVPPELYGGIELVVDRLARGFDRIGHEVLLFTTGESTCPVPKASLLPHAEGQRIGAAVPEIRHALAAYEAVQGFDIVHDHTVVGPFLAERWPALKVASTIHGDLKGELADLCRQVSKQVSLIAISQSQHRPARDIPIARVIHHGLDAIDFPFGDRDGGYCLFLGRMSADKGAHRAILAARKAGIDLKMAAKMREPSELEYFENEVQPLLGDGIEYLGEVPHHQKLELLAAARALLFPIRWNEPFGMVMIEAMACGTPVIAFPEGAAPEVIRDGETGFLVDDEDEMASAIDRVSELDRRTCRRAVETYFSTDRMVAEHVELFEQILSS